MDERQQDAMGQDVEFNADLSLNCPRGFTENMIEECLIANPDAGLPLACDMWAGIVRSMKYDHLSYLLYFNKLDDCMLLNPRTGLWESMPPLFSPADALRLQHMKLIACDEGLLFFASSVGNELIVGNPFTQCCSATLRGREAAQLICNAQYEARKSYPSKTRLRWQTATLWDPVSSSKQDIARDISVNTCVSAEFQLEVTQRHRYGMTRSVSLELRDSRSVDWVIESDVGGDFHLLCFPIYLCEARVPKGVILGFCTCPRPCESNVLVYDILEQRCRWVRDPCPLRISLTLCTSVSDSGELELLEIVDGALNLAKAPFPPPTTVLQKNLSSKILQDGTTFLESDEMFNFLSVQKGDDEYHICLLRQDSPRDQVYISVRTLNLVTHSQRISNWSDISPSASESREWPTSNNFHVFRPPVVSGEVDPEIDEFNL